MNDLDVILATVEELRGYLWAKRKQGKLAVIRRIRKLRPDLKVEVLGVSTTAPRYLLYRA